jgi:hypothetical protein
MNGRFRLWTPVANALEAYRRRVLRDPNATYEHIWRLIHIHEALVATLGAVLSTRLLQGWQSIVENQGRLNRLRSMVTGLPEDTDAVPQSTAEFCFSGSVKAWIDILQVFGKGDSLPTCTYCGTLSEYLMDKNPEKVLYHPRTLRFYLGYSDLTRSTLSGTSSHTFRYRNGFCLNFTEA